MKTISIKIFVFEAGGGEVARRKVGRRRKEGEKNRGEERMDNGE